MNKYIKIFAALFTLLFTAFAFAANPLSFQKTNAVLNGENYLGVNAYDITSNTKFLSLKEVAGMYNATLEWKPVSSLVSVHVNNKKIDIVTNSSTVFFGKKKKKMSVPTRLINGDLYISPEILTSKEFSEIAEADTSWNPESLILNVKHHSNISGVRYFTTPECTQIIIELTEKLPYSIYKATGAIMVSVHRGKVQRNFMHLDNGAVQDIFYETDGKSAIVQINLQQTPKIVKSSSLKNPNSIIVTIDHSKEIDVAKLSAPLIADSQSSAASSKNIDGDISESPDQFGKARIIELESDDDTVGNEDLAAVPVREFTADAIDDNYVIVEDVTTASAVLPKADVSKSIGRKRIIVIDAGHGGEDPGAIGPNGTKEKDINLAIAMELKKIFDKDGEYEIVLTRKDDTFIPLVERTNIANEHNADLFISVHCNANFNRNAAGFEIYFLSENATDSEAAATATLENSVIELEGKPTKKRALLQEMLWSMMLNEYMNESSELSSFIASETPGRLQIPNRGVKQASFYVLRGTQMPAVLVESAFLSNYAEESKLGTKKFQTAVADSIYEGVKKFYLHKEKKQNGTK